MSECSTQILSVSVILDKDGNEQWGQNALDYFHGKLVSTKKSFVTLASGENPIKQMFDFS